MTLLRLQLTEMTADLAEEHNTATLAAERLVRRIFHEEGSKELHCHILSDK